MKLSLVTFGALFAVAAAAAEPTILIIGDSWGTISPATEYFEKGLKNCSHKLNNIAIGGTTAKQWAADDKLSQTAQAAKSADYVWITLMGNDALAEMPGCASEGKSAPECGDRLYADVLPRMEKIVDNIHSANPNAQIVGFGYDLMFGGFGCGFVTKDLFPQCWKNSSIASPNRCFNTQLIRIQEGWEQLAKTRPFLTAINLLGATQVAGGVKGAEIGKPNLDLMGPAEYWPITLECFHPSRPAGAEVIMAEFYKQYWSQKLKC